MEAYKKAGPGNLCIEVYVDCPHCSETIDLIDANLFYDEFILKILKQVLTSKPDGKLGCTDVGEGVMCPECKQYFTVGRVD